MLLTICALSSDSRQSAIASRCEWPFAFASDTNLFISSISGPLEDLVTSTFLAGAGGDFFDLFGFTLALAFLGTRASGLVALDFCCFNSFSSLFAAASWVFLYGKGTGEGVVSSSGTSNLTGAGPFADVGTPAVANRSHSEISWAHCSSECWYSWPTFK